MGDPTEVLLWDSVLLFTVNARTQPILKGIATIVMQPSANYLCNLPSDGSLRTTKPSGSRGQPSSTTAGTKDRPLPNLIYKTHLQADGTTIPMDHARGRGTLTVGQNLQNKTTMNGSKNGSKCKCHVVQNWDTHGFFVFFCLSNDCQRLRLGCWVHVLASVLVCLEIEQNLLYVCTFWMVMVISTVLLVGMHAVSFSRYVVPASQILGHIGIDSSIRRSNLQNFCKNHPMFPSITAKYYARSPQIESSVVSTRSRWM